MRCSRRYWRLVQLPPPASRPGDALADARNFVRSDNSNKLQDLLRKQPELLTTPFENGKTLLTEAAGAGKHNAMQAILMQARLSSSTSVEDVVSHCSADGNPLTRAVLNGHLGLAQSLLMHEEVAKEVAERNPALADAIRHGRLDVAKSLVVLGPQNPKLTSTDKSLSEACRAAVGSDAGKLQALLQQNPELLTMQLGNKETLLTTAASAGKASSVQVILEHARLTRPAYFQDIINHRNGDGDTALAQAARGSKLDVVAMLLACDETKVNITNDKGETALHHAAKAEDPGIAVQLLHHDSILPGAADENGNTPLHLAIKLRRSDIAVKIAAHPKGFPDQANREHRTPLATAVDLMDLTVIHALLRNDNVDPNRKSGPNGRGLSPLWQALTKWTNNILLGGSDDRLSPWQHMLGVLVASPKVNANTLIVKGDARETPLTYLCTLQRPWEIAEEASFAAWQLKTVKTLLSSSQTAGGRHSLDLNAKNSAGQTAYDVALAQGRWELAQALMLDPRTRSQA